MKQQLCSIRNQHTIMHLINACKIDSFEFTNENN
jgi:hypothetical protein